MIKYTEEEKEFLKSFIPGHSYIDVAAEFTNRFRPVNTEQIIAYAKHHRIRNGLDTRFKKGRVPHNKGVKGVCGKGCERTWFKKGAEALKTKPVGTEVVIDGYLKVKVAEPNVWKFKHRLVWEKVHGEIPKGHLIIFKDNNSLNCDLDNLLCISRAEHAVINNKGLGKYMDELKDVVVNIAKLKIAVSKKKKGGLK